ncbi:MAG: site-specific DNA-methyltransferase [Ruminococcus flavefaciens]
MYGYSTEYGECLCGDCRDLIENLSDNSVDLMITSPPYPLLFQPDTKDYHSVSPDIYEEWLLDIIERFLPKLKPTGSLVIEFGTAYLKGEPAYNIYAFRMLVKLVDGLGLKLCQPFYWHNPSRIHMNIYIIRRKIRAKDHVNNIWWLSKTANPKADTTQVLQKYSKAMKKLFKKKKLKNTTWKKNDGALPSNLLQFSNADNKNQYLQACRDLGFQHHTARFPQGLLDFFIKLLTDEGDLVVDIFGGSNTTGYVAEKLGRHWKAFEMSKEYVATSAFRFIDDVKDAQDCYNKIINSDSTVDISQLNKKD